MNVNSVPPGLPIALEDACSLSAECWRLRKLSETVKDPGTRSGLRHAVRRITEMLEKLEIEAVDLAGRSYDAGMVPDVVEVRQDPALPDGRSVVAETIAPTITWRGQVVHHGKIVVARSGTGPPIPSEVRE